MVNSNPGPGYKKYPDYKVNISPFEGRVSIFVKGKMIASTRNALKLEEARLTPVYYFPKSDLVAEYYFENSSETYCPFKGNARYWDVRIDGDVIEQVVWGYDEPYDEVAILSEYVAFYTDKVRIIVD